MSDKLVNLDTFIGNSLSLIRNQKDRRRNELAAQELLPQIQTDRSYKEIEKIPDSEKQIDPQMVLFNANQWNGKWKMIYNLYFPTFGINKENVTPDQLLSFAKKYLKNNTDDKDIKYIEIELCTKEKIVYTWNIYKWLGDNFAGAKPTFDPPISLLFKYNIGIPRFVWVVSHASLDLRQFVENKFQLFMKGHTNKLSHDRLRFLKVISADDFEYSLDYQFSRIKASLKYSVIFGSMAAFFLFNRSIIDKKQLKMMKTVPKTKREIEEFKKFLSKMR